MAAFYRTFAPAALTKGWLRVFGLEQDGALRAVQYGFAYGGSFLALQEGFDPDAAPGAGNVLRSHAFQRCIEEGLREYDFLGGFTEHKRRWGAEIREGRDVFLGRKRLKTALLFSQKVWPTGRYLVEDAPENAAAPA
jgi:CelD/BcsL family acetyltransferase involved in cellulose biosynthesis